MAAFSKVIKYWLPVLLWMAVIFTASTDAMSSSNTSRIIGPVLRWLFPGIDDSTISTVQFLVRKASHAAEYGVLSLLVYRARVMGGGKSALHWHWREALFAFLFAALYAVTDEVHQAFVPSRQMLVGDMLIDSAGAAAALLSLGLLQRCQRLCCKHRMPAQNA